VRIAEEHLDSYAGDHEPLPPFYHPFSESIPLERC
jgi:hypothetical protein